MPPRPRSSRQHNPLVHFPSGSERDFLARVALGVTEEQQEQQSLHDAVFGADSFGLIFVEHRWKGFSHALDRTAGDRLDIMRTATNFVRAYMPHRLHVVKLVPLELGSVTVVFVRCGPKTLPLADGVDPATETKSQRNVRQCVAMRSCDAAGIVRRRRAGDDDYENEDDQDDYAAARRKLEGEHNDEQTTVSSEHGHRLLIMTEEQVPLIIDRLSRRTRSANPRKMPILLAGSAALLPDKEEAAITLTFIVARCLTTLIARRCGADDEITRRVRQLQQFVFTPQVFQAVKLPTGDFATAVAMCAALEVLASMYPREIPDTFTIGAATAITVTAAATAATGPLQVVSAPLTVSVPKQPLPTIHWCGHISLIVAEEFSGAKEQLAALPNISDGGLAVVIFRSAAGISRDSVAAFGAEITSNSRFPFVAGGDSTPPLWRLERPNLFSLRIRQLVRCHNPPPRLHLFAVTSLRRGIAEELEESVRQYQASVPEEMRDPFQPTLCLCKNCIWPVSQINRLVERMREQVACASSKRSLLFYDWENCKLVPLSKWKKMTWAPIADEFFVSCSLGPDRWKSRPDHQNYQVRLEVILQPHTMQLLPRMPVSYVLETRDAITRMIHKDYLVIDLPLALTSTNNRCNDNNSNANRSKLFHTGYHYTLVARILSFLTLRDGMRSLDRLTRATHRAFEELRVIQQHCLLQLPVPADPSLSLRAHEHRFRRADERKHISFPDLGLTPLSPLQTQEIFIRRAEWNAIEGGWPSIQFVSEPGLTNHTVETSTGKFVDILPARDSDDNDNPRYYYSVFPMRVRGEKDLWGRNLDLAAFTFQGKLFWLQERVAAGGDRRPAELYFYNTGQREIYGRASPWQAFQVLVDGNSNPLPVTPENFGLPSRPYKGCAMLWSGDMRDDPT